MAGDQRRDGLVAGLRLSAVESTRSVKTIVRTRALPGPSAGRPFRLRRARRAPWRGAAAADTSASTAPDVVVMASPFFHGQLGAAPGEHRERIARRRAREPTLRKVKASLRMAPRPPRPARGRVPRLRGSGPCGATLDSRASGGRRASDAWCSVLRVQFCPTSSPARATRARRSGGSSPRPWRAAACRSAG